MRGKVNKRTLIANYSIMQNTPKSHLRVLLAEDNPLAQRIALHAIPDGQYQVTLVDNGRAAVDAVRDQDFDAVLMDVEMPEMDGLSAARLIRRREESTGKHVPIIAVTSNENEAECIDAGMDAFVRKNDVKSSIETVLGKWVGQKA